MTFRALLLAEGWVVLSPRIYSFQTGGGSFEFNHHVACFSVSDKTAKERAEQLASELNRVCNL